MLVKDFFADACCFRHYLRFPSREERERYQVVLEIWGDQDFIEFEFEMLNQDLYIYKYTPSQLYFADSFYKRYYMLQRELNKTCFFY